MRSYHSISLAYSFIKHSVEVLLSNQYYLTFYIQCPNKLKHLSKNLKMKFWSLNLPTFPFWEQIITRGGNKFLKKFFYNVVICVIAL